MSSEWQNQERAGWCGACRTIWQWTGLPTQQDACCPRVGCGLPLARKPRKPLGRYRAENATPLTRQKPELVLTEVSYVSSE